jgi:8-amino-7-oxononanoate synthase
MLQANIRRFTALAAHAGLPLLPSNTAIQPLLAGGNDRAMRWSEALRARGFWVGAIRPPTVPPGTARLRITLTALHTPTQIEALVEALDALLKDDDGPAY